MQAWLNGFNMRPQPFNTKLRAFSAPYYDGADSEKITEINYGGKILLPSSALDALIRLNIQYPMLFKITNGEDNGIQRATHCGVLEFSASEGRCYLPHWMMQQLLLEEGSFVRVESATLNRATFARLKPQSLDFLSISNPRAVLEVELRKFACLTQNDRIAVRYADQILEFLVQELKPANAVCIIECDLNLEFDAPEGYVEGQESKSTYQAKPPAPSYALPSGSSGSQFSAFGGAGVRLDGKKKRSSNSLCSEAPSEPGEVLAPVICNVDYKPGKLSFIRYDYKARVNMEKELKEKLEAEKNSMQPFQGKSATVRKRY